MEYKIYTTGEFDRRFSKLDKELQRQVDKEIEQLQANPYAGKPLGYKFFREKKSGKNLIYSLFLPWLYSA